MFSYKLNIATRLLNSYKSWWKTKCSGGHIPIPYVMAYDMYPLTTLNEKKSFLEEAVEGNYTLFFEHDPVHECCNLQRTEKGIRAKDYFKLEEIG